MIRGTQEHFSWLRKLEVSINKVVCHHLRNCFRCKLDFIQNTCWNWKLLISSTEKNLCVMNAWTTCKKFMIMCHFTFDNGEYDIIRRSKNSKFNFFIIIWSDFWVRLNSRNIIEKNLLFLGIPKLFDSIDRFMTNIMVKKETLVKFWFVCEWIKILMFLEPGLVLVVAYVAMFYGSEIQRFCVSGSSKVL